MRKSSSAKTLPGHGPRPLPGATLTSTMKSLSQDNLSIRNGSDNNVDGDGSVNSLAESSLASSSVSGAEGVGVKAEVGMTHADQKMFAKMKRNKMGKVDPKTLLHEETKALEESEVRENKKTKERSTLVDASMGKWIMGLLQTSQINKTSEGTTSAPPAPGLLPTSNLENPVIDSPMKASQPQGGGEHNPQTAVPFQEFYEMFKTYSDEQQKVAEEAARKEEEELLEAQRRAQEEEEAAAALAQAEAEAEARGRGLLQLPLLKRGQKVRTCLMVSIVKPSPRH